MKYRLKKDLPGVKAGEIYTSDGEGCVLVDSDNFSYMFEAEDYPEWFEPVKERIKLEQYWPGSDDICFVARLDKKPITRDQIDLMGKALNGEMWDEEQIRSWMEGFTYKDQTWTEFIIEGAINELKKLC